MHGQNTAFQSYVRFPLQPWLQPYSKEQPCKASKNYSYAKKRKLECHGKQDMVLGIDHIQKLTITPNHHNQ